MGIINIVQNIKQIKKEDIIFVQVGNFYNCYGKDAYIISYLFNYKISIIDDICMVSFPKTAYNKVISKLENIKINYIVLDKRNNYEEEKNNNKNLNKYAEFYEKARNEIAIKIRIEKIQKYLSKTKDKEKIFEIEKVINERRKIQSN